ncbi:MAG: hypothetical protein GY811_12880 [Myxococcales bacterium]|nr:hypothetical protein [Myxococcales bacterium]
MPLPLPLRRRSSLLQLALSCALSTFVVTVMCGCGPGGSEPVMQAVGDQLAVVNQELVIALSGSDADGDEVFYTYESNVPDIHSRAALSRLPNGGGEFRWTPQAQDVGEWFFDFTASDGSKSDTITIRIEVRAAIGGNSSPRFVHPQGSGTTLDLSESACLELNVEVVDGDTPDVALEQGLPIIEGAELDVISGTTATWSWCPSEQQIEASDRYNLLLTADDGDNPTSLHPYLIVLRSPLKPNCPGDAPVVTHTPSDLSSLVGIAIEAVISDDQGLKQEPLLYYSTTTPGTPPDLGQMIQVTMEQGTGDNWTAEIPNPVASLSQGATADLYYVIVADDDDDPIGNCDHRTQAPTTAFFSMTVTNPGGAGGAGLCEPCTTDVQCGDAADRCVAIGPEADSVCLSDCGSACPTDFECSVGDLESVDGAPSRQCVPLSLDCSEPGGTVCMDDVLEHNDSRVEALANPLLDADAIHNLVSCPAAIGTGDDEDWFEIFVPQEGSLNIDLAFDSAISDVDVDVYDESGTFIDSSSGFGATESLRLCVPQGFYLIRVYAFSSAENPYTLQHSSSAQSCDVETCVADILEEDDTSGQATAVDLDAGIFDRPTLTLCEADEDWYRVELDNSELLAVDLTFEQGATGDLDIHFFDSGLVDLTPCGPVDVSSCDTSNGQSATSNESAIFEAPATGCSPCEFFVVVQGFDGDENEYGIRIEGSN